MESKPKQEEIVDAILPPREWIENGKIKQPILLITAFLIKRKALHRVCQPLKSIQSRRCALERDTWLKTDGETGPRKWDLPRERRTIFTVFWRNHPSSNPEGAWERHSTVTCPWRNQNDNCCLSDPLCEFGHVCHEKITVSRDGQSRLGQAHLRLRSAKA